MNPPRLTDVLAYACPKPRVAWWRQSPAGAGSLVMAVAVALADVGVRAGVMLTAHERLRSEVVLALAFAVLVVLPVSAAGVAAWSLTRPGERRWYPVTSLVIVVVHGWVVALSVLNERF